MLTTTIERYEILLRFENDKLRGAHLQQKAVIRDGEKFITEQLLPAAPIGELADFKLNDVLSGALQSALLAREEAVAKLAEAKKDSDQRQQEANAQVATLNAAITKQQAEIDRLTTAAKAPKEGTPVE